MARLLLAISTLLLFAPVAAPASAPDAPGEVAPRRVTAGVLLWRAEGGGALVASPALDTHVDLRVTGLVARATVRQEFINPATTWAEGVYVFPLPEDAAVDRLRMRVGDRRVGRRSRRCSTAATSARPRRTSGRR
jgi:Ca-activated chloride channel family protein